MPTYKYECKNCGYIFKELQSMNDKPLRKCPKCGKLKLQRLIGKGIGIIYKGSGFYTTDYNKKKSTDQKQSTSKPETKPAKKEQKKPKS